MDQKMSYGLANKLLKAISPEEVNEIVMNEEYRYYFDQPEYWKNYGNRDKNLDTAGNQQSSGVGALVENVVNGMDAVLLRKAEEFGIKEPLLNSMWVGAGVKGGQSPAERTLDAGPQPLREWSGRCATLTHRP